MYNATVYRSCDGKHIGTFVAEVLDGVILRSNTVKYYDGTDGTPAYDARLRADAPRSTFEIVLDNCEGYKRRMGGFALPPAYGGGL